MHPRKLRQSKPTARLQNPALDNLQRCSAVAATDALCRGPPSRCFTPLGNKSDFATLEQIRWWAAIGQKCFMGSETCAPQTPGVEIRVKHKDGDPIQPLS
jgi:hypothetical protein